MDKLLAGLFGIILAAAIFFGMALVLPIVGAFSGWVVGMFFGDTIYAVLNAFGVNTQNVEIWQIGLTLAFIGSFFKAVQTSKSD